jgi:hypothetical protein
MLLLVVGEAEFSQAHIRPAAGTRAAGFDSFSTFEREALTEMVEHRIS